MRTSFHRLTTALSTTPGKGVSAAALAVAAGAASYWGVSSAAAAFDSGEPSSSDLQQAAVDSEYYDLVAVNEDTDLGANHFDAYAPQVLALPEYKPVAGIDEQLSKAVTAAEQLRIDSEAALAESLGALYTAPSLTGSSHVIEWAGQLVANPAPGVFTSGYGMRWGIMHSGIDLAAPIGTPIYAVMAGTVIDAGPAVGFGNWVRILHDDGTVTVYGHMESIAVSVGERVSAGQYIAGIGSRGWSTGPHLHFEVHPGGGGAIDPIPWLAERGIYVG